MAAQDGATAGSDAPGDGDGGHYVLLTGAMVNAGDFLIGDRAKRLLRAHRPDRELVELPRWEPLDAHLDTVNGARALLLTGGPAFQPHVYPDVYPLVDDLSAIRVPIAAYGLGWKGAAGDARAEARYAFNQDAHQLLARVRRDGAGASVRDHPTARVLARHGLPGATVTGCPAWYDLERLGEPFRPPESVARVVVSTPAGADHHDGCVALAEGVQARFPDATVTCAFNHGWTAGPHVSREKANHLATLRDALHDRGLDTRSLAGDLDGMDRLLREADVHIGYRLHAHLHFVSRRRASILLEEDGRGTGASESLGLPGVRAWARRRVLPGVTARPDAADAALARLDEALDTDWARHRGLGATLDAYHDKAMAPFLQGLP